MDKCKKTGCEEKRTCLYYCDRHHQDVCLSGHKDLKSFLNSKKNENDGCEMCNGEHAFELPGNYWAWCGKDLHPGNHKCWGWKV